MSRHRKTLEAVMSGAADASVDFERLHAKAYQVRQVRNVLRRYHGGDAADD